MHERGTPAAERPGSSALAETRFAQDRLWDDGQAELSCTRARAPREGVQRDFRAAVIVVKETFDPKLFVKSDAGQVSSRAPAPQVEQAEVSLDGGGHVYVRGGGGASDTFDLDRSPLRAPRRWERRDGGPYQLESTRRIRYRELSRPGDQLDPAHAPR